MQGYQGRLLFANETDDTTKVSDNIRATYREAAKDAHSLILGEKEVLGYKDKTNREFMDEYKVQVIIAKVEVDRDESKVRQQVINELKQKGGIMIRRRLPDERPAINHKFVVQGYEGYLVVGLFDNGLPGEVFIYISKTGSLLCGMMDAFAIAISLLLQYNVPLEVLTKKFIGMRFEPSGFTHNPDFRSVTSILDYIFKWMEKKFLPEDKRQHSTEAFIEEKINEFIKNVEEEVEIIPEEKNNNELQDDENEI